MVIIKQLNEDVETGDRPEKLRNVGGELLYDEDDYLILTKKPSGTTADATPEIIFAITIANGATVMIEYNIIGRKINPGGAGDGDSLVAQGKKTYKAIGGVVTLVDDTAPPLVDEFGGMVNFNISGNDVEFEIVGVIATDINWRGKFEII